MVEKKNGLSLDFIIHPGETVKELLEEKKMNQEELAIRTGFSAKHISEVVNGKNPISPLFAKCLEYVFGIPATFWINLQGIYDKEMLEYKEQEEIDENEVEIIKALKKVINYAEKLGIIPKTKNQISQIIDLRSICNVNKLTYIKDLVSSQVAFRKSQTIETNPYVLYVWVRICELLAEKSDVQNSYNEDVLKENISNIKKCMFLEINEAINELQKIFSECGITFQVVKNFTGAPVQGFIKKSDNRIILSMTIRGAFSDIFWFTLFHEIGHLLNRDISNSSFIDFTEYRSDNEAMADKFARETLIKEEDFNSFIMQPNLSETDIIKFAKEQGVQPFIVVGRIQRQKNNYKIFSNLRKRYTWE